MKVKKIWFFFFAISLVYGIFIISCERPAEEQNNEEFDALNNTDCFEVTRGETTCERWISDYDTLVYNYDGTDMTVIRLHELVDSEVTDAPEDYRYQIYGTDGYTYGGYATWTNICNAYLEIGTRRVVFDPDQELPHSYNVKWAYRMVLSPATREAGE